MQLNVIKTGCQSLFLDSRLFKWFNHFKDHFVVWLSTFLSVNNLRRALKGLWWSGWEGLSSPTNSLLKLSFFLFSFTPSLTREPEDIFSILSKSDASIGNYLQTFNFQFSVLKNWTFLKLCTSWEWILPKVSLNWRLD